MPYAKFKSSQLVGTAVVEADVVVASEQDYIDTAVEGGAAIQLDPSSANPAHAAAWALCTKSAALDLEMGAGTPRTLDLTALVAEEAAPPTRAGKTPTVGGLCSMAGVTSFATVFVLEVFNNAAIGSGMNVTIGNDGTTAEFFAPIGTAKHVVIIAPQTGHVFTIQEPAGWPVSATSKKLKIDGGAQAAEVFVAIGGA